MHKAIAFGFYAKHPLIMDELYNLDDLDKAKDLEGLPAQLVQIVDSNSELLTSLIKQAVLELEEFETSLNRALESVVKKGAKIRASRPPQWEGKVKVSPLDGRMKRAKPIEIGWEWSTEENEMFIDPWIWMKGGRSAEILLSDTLSTVAARLSTRSARDFDKGTWETGSVRLGRINVSERVDGDFGINLDDLHHDALAFYEWINETTLRRLFEGSCNI